MKGNFSKNPYPISITRQSPLAVRPNLRQSICNASVARPDHRHGVAAPAPRSPLRHAPWICWAYAALCVMDARLASPDGVVFRRRAFRKRFLKLNQCNAGSFGRNECQCCLTLTWSKTTNDLIAHLRAESPPCSSSGSSNRPEEFAPRRPAYLGTV